MSGVNISDCKKILIYGGTFDPPHVAHVALPIKAMQVIGADAIAYVPAAISPLKTSAPGSITPGSDRLTMLALALHDEPRAMICTDELDRSGDGQPSYTVDTLEALKQKWGDRIELRLLIGTDQMLQFHRWKNPQRIVELAEPVVMLRPPEDKDSVLASLPDEAQRQVWKKRLLTGLEKIDVSSSDIRRRLKVGESIHNLVCPAVEAYILEHRLYRHD